jgi:hypothetical protein
MRDMSTYKEENRQRLVNLLRQVKSSKEPEGWKHVTSMAIGGLLSVGFSEKSNYLLVVSSQGRGLVDCESGEKIARDEEPYEGLSDHNLYCEGIGPVKNETIKLCSYNGGGLPQSNSAGESLELVAPEWPEYDLILCGNYKNALIPGDQSYCTKIYSEYIRAFGFSWCGNYIVAACGSDIDLWKRVTKL